MSIDHETISGVQPSRISKPRQAARSRFNEMFRAFVTLATRAGVTTRDSIASQLGVSPQYVSAQFDPTHVTGVLAAGDLHGLEAGDLVGLLEFWLEDVRGRLAPTKPAVDPRFLAMAASERVGSVAKTVRKAMADERCDGPEWREIEAQFEAMEREARSAKLACRAAAEVSK